MIFKFKNDKVYLFLFDKKIYIGKTEFFSLEMKNYNIFFFSLLQLFSVCFLLYFYMEVFEIYDTSDSIFIVAIVFTSVFSAMLFICFLTEYLYNKYFYDKLNKSKRTAEDTKSVITYQSSLVISIFSIFFVLWMDYGAHGTSNERFFLIEVHPFLYLINFIILFYLNLIYVYTMTSYLSSIPNISYLKKIRNLYTKYLIILDNEKQKKKHKEYYK